jgi:hypothetical protein
VPVDPLLKLDLLQQVVDVDGARLGDHAADADAPRALLELLRHPPEVLAVVELVIVVVGGGGFFVGDGPARLVFVVARPHGTQRSGGRWGGRRCDGGRRGVRRQGSACRGRSGRQCQRAGQQAATAQRQSLRRGQPFRDFPAPAPYDVHP